MPAYQRMAESIRYLAHHYLEQPTLREAAAQAGLSPFHFQRQFTDWVGVSPKDFVRSLTLSRARTLLRQGDDVLGASLESGLSGPGRLHDLCVRLSAASPGEIKTGGQGLDLTSGFATSPFGCCLVAQSVRGVCHLSFQEPSRAEEALADLRTDWPRARWHQDHASAQGLVDQMFRPAPGNRRPVLRAWVKGTAFQVRVWEALLRIPPGRVVSYGQLAGALGSPGASRAVGGAVGANPVAWLIPCHRVIQASGALGGYRWGAGCKRSLLAWESCRFGKAEAPSREPSLPCAT